MFLNVVLWQFQEPDKTPPACSSLHVESSCPSLCSQGSWKVSLLAKDRGHSGLASIQLAQGEGTLILSEVTTEIHIQHFPQLHEETTEGVHLPLLQPQKDNSEISNHHLGTGAEHVHQGLAGVQLVNGDYPVNISEWTKGKPVMMRYSSGCCAPQAEIILLDRAGNMRRCHLIASQQRALRENNSAHSVEFTSLLVLMLWGHLALSIIYDPSWNLLDLLFIMQLYVDTTSFTHITSTYHALILVHKPHTHTHKRFVTQGWYVVSSSQDNCIIMSERQHFSTSKNLQVGLI